MQPAPNILRKFLTGSPFTGTRFLRVHTLQRAHNQDARAHKLEKLPPVNFEIVSRPSAKFIAFRLNRNFEI